ncbi:MAG TPA: hypothetical protein VF891_01470 [Gaiellaceae bacterium]
MRRFAALLVLPFAFAGCGGEATSLDPVAEAATKTADVGSARFQLEMSIPDPDTGETLHFRGPGLIADHGELISMKMHLDPTKDTPAFTMDTVMTDDAMYLHSSLFQIAMPRGKQWLKAREDDPVGNIGQNDPGQMLDYLQGAGSVEKIGSDTVRGLRTTKYRARIELGKVVEKIPEERRARMQHAIDVLHDIGVNEIPMIVWVDDDDLVRRQTMDWTVKNPDDPSDRFHLKATLELFDFGTKARVVVPPVAKTMSYAKFLKQAGGG